MLKQGISVIIDQENVPLEEDQVQDGQTLYQAEIAFEIARNVATSTMQTSKSLEDQNHPFLAEGQNLCNLAIDYKRKRLSAGALLFDVEADTIKKIVKNWIKKEPRNDMIDNYGIIIEYVSQNCDCLMIESMYDSAY